MSPTVLEGAPRIEWNYHNRHANAHHQTGPGPPLELFHHRRAACPGCAGLVGLAPESAFGRRDLRPPGLQYGDRISLGLPALAAALRHAGRLQLGPGLS